MEKLMPMPGKSKQPKDGTSGEKANAKTGGAKGVDKAPGEDPATAREDFIRKAQKGKKVDRDPSNPNDQPAKI